VGSGWAFILAMTLSFNEICQLWPSWGSVLMETEPFVAAGADSPFEPIIGREAPFISGILLKDFLENSKLQAEGKLSDIRR